MQFLPNIAVIFAFCLATAALTITPGPDMALFVGKSIVKGRVAGLAALLGTMTGVVAHTLLVALGLSALLAASVTAFTALKIAGALYLAWLAYDAIRNGSGLNIDKLPIASSETLPQLFLKGLTVNLLNPKVIMFFITFLPQFVNADDPHATGKLIFLGLLFVVVATPICVALVFSAARLAGLLKRSPKIMRAVDYIFASVVAGFAVRLIIARPG